MPVTVTMGVQWGAPWGVARVLELALVVLIAEDHLRVRVDRLCVTVV